MISLRSPPRSTTQIPRSRSFPPRGRSPGGSLRSRSRNPAPLANTAPGKAARRRLSRGGPRSPGSTSSHRRALRWSHPGSSPRYSIKIAESRQEMRTAHSTDPSRLGGDATYPFAASRSPCRCGSEAITVRGVRGPHVLSPSPYRTARVASRPAAGGPRQAGILSVVPARMRSLRSPFARLMALMVTPWRRAIRVRLSPRRTR